MIAIIDPISLTVILCSAIGGAVAGGEKNSVVDGIKAVGTIVGIENGISHLDSGSNNSTNS